MKQTTCVRTCDICNEKIEEKGKGYHAKSTFYRIKKRYISSSLINPFEKNETIDMCESCMARVRLLYIEELRKKGREIPKVRTCSESEDE